MTFHHLCHRNRHRLAAMPLVARPALALALALTLILTGCADGEPAKGDRPTAETSSPTRPDFRVSPLFPGDLVMIVRENPNDLVSLHREPVIEPYAENWTVSLPAGIEGQVIEDAFANPDDPLPARSVKLRLVTGDRVGTEGYIERRDLRPMPELPAP